MRYDLDQTIFRIVNNAGKELEEKMQSCVVAYFGTIHPGYLRPFRDTIEDVKSKTTYKRVCLLLRTGGGSAEVAERMAIILRDSFENVDFLVADAAMSAGTILCMSGDKIYMDYSSALGPIDPQVITPDGRGFVPAMGYLDKVKELTEKLGALTQAEVIFLRGIDLGQLALFEQAKNFSISLLKKWLVEYKFKNWSEHRTTNAGTAVSAEEKQARAQQIAEDLSDHKRWFSHGRALDITKLRSLRLEIDDIRQTDGLHELVRAYNDPLSMYVDRMDIEFFIHNHMLMGN